MSEPRVYFGHKEVSAEEKRAGVKTVFDSVANRYDVMNDVMSLGTHRILKRILVETTALRGGQSVLDIASGTGDVGRLLKRAVGNQGLVASLDINESMLREGRNRSIDAGDLAIRHVVADAEILPFEDGYFHAVTIAFGLRNVSNKEQAISEFHRVLKPGGRLVVLDFAKPSNSVLAMGFDAFKRTWPIAGHFIAGSAQPYQYLVDSIDTHPNQKVISLMLSDNGFTDVRCDNLLGGIAALHWGTA